MLCVTNMLLHGIEDPSFVRHDNTLARPPKGIASRPLFRIFLGSKSDLENLRIVAKTMREIRSFNRKRLTAW